jgi:hypothetical protein
VDRLWIAQSPAGTEAHDAPRDDKKMERMAPKPERKLGCVMIYRERFVVIHL